MNDDINVDVVKSTNPFSGVKKAFSTSPFTQQAPPKKLSEEEQSVVFQPEPVVQIKMQEFCGALIEPHHFQHLEQLFKQAGFTRETPVWVSQSSLGIQLVPSQNPRLAGYQLVKHPVKSFIYGTLATVGASLLGLKVENHSLELPNGGELSLAQEAWHGPDGKSADLFQVVGLPDGTWLRLTAPFTQEIIPLDDQKRLRNAMDKRITQLEKSGKFRELKPVTNSTQASLPLEQSDRVN